MFAEGSKEPYERTRRIIEKLAGPLKATPYRVSITGHTSASKVPPKADYGPWNLSADRANAVRQILEEEGFPPGNIYEVAGRADTDPLFPEDPYIAANRRVTITLMHEAPPVPLGCSRRFGTSLKGIPRRHPPACFGCGRNLSVFSTWGL